MESRTLPIHYFYATLILASVSVAMAGFITLSAELVDIKGVGFLPVFVVIAALHIPSSVRRLAESLGAGPQGRASVISIRSEYLQLVTQHPELRAWPESTLSCLLAAAAILVKAAFRAWIVILLSVLLSQILGTEIKSEIGTLWGVFTCIEAVLIGFRSYNRGTLPLAGMSVSEMEQYFRDRIARAQDGYLSPGP